jgi:hypothetical protein
MHCYRCHPALNSGRLGPLKGGTQLHLHQSDIDGACGPHCVLMGLLLLGGIQRKDLLRLPKPRSRSLASLWRRTENTYFIGTTTRDLKAILHPFRDVIETHVCRKDHMERTLDTLRQSGLAIINIESATMNHWVLAIGIVGVENRAGFQVSRLLILDPSHGPIPLAAWNATLSVRPDRQDRHSYETPEGRQLVSVGAVLTLRQHDRTGQ